MTYALVLAFAGISLIIAGLVGHGWNWLGIWLGCDFLALAVAHAMRRHRLFGKRPDGSLPVWSWIIFGPLLIYTLAVWHLLRLFVREPPSAFVTENLSIGRRLLPSELRETFEQYVDLTAEFAEPNAIARVPMYRSFPILDAAAPTPEALRDAVSSLGPGRTFVHCAQGRGRTGLFALALLISRGDVQDIDDGLKLLGQARPGIRLNQAQLRCLESFCQRLSR